jgi:hypothetical protein
VSSAMSLLRLSRRESWWKDAEILMLRHQLAVAQRQQPRAHSRLTWPDRAWLALLAGTVPPERLAAMRLIVTPGTIVRWHRDIVRRRWARRSRRAGTNRYVCPSATGSLPPGTGHRPFRARIRCEVCRLQFCLTGMVAAIVAAKGPQFSTRADMIHRVPSCPWVCRDVASPGPSALTDGKPPSR